MAYKTERAALRRQKTLMVKMGIWTAVRRNSDGTFTLLFDPEGE